jgi:predicted alpha/beta superfamily hydrolase
MIRNFILSFFIYSILISAQQKVEVQFIVITHTLADSERISISGNNTELGNWDAGKIFLTRISDTTYSKSFKFSEGENIEYKITRGSWDKEAVGSDGSVPNNSFLKINSDTTIIVQIAGWKDQFRQNIHGQITGKVEYIKNYQFGILEPRDIVIWFPPSYSINPERHFPVLYLHDGQNIFDPAASSFGYDWRFDEVSDSLIKIGEIDELIIVGINNTKYRWQEYSPGDTGTAYMNLIVNKIKPLIDSRYRTLPQRENTFVGGSSMGGLISFMLVWQYPEIFSKAICVSPAFKIRNVEYVSAVENYQGEQKPIKIYIDNGEVGLESELQPGIDDMLIALQNKNYQMGSNLFWYKYDNAQHSERDWSKRVWRMLKFLFDKNLD